MQNVRLLGVCNWLSALSGVDVVLIGVLFIGATILGFGSPIVIYLILYRIKELKAEQTNKY